MKNTYYIAIDIGASSGRHIVGRLEDGKIKLKEVYRFANGAKHSGGHLVWNAARLEREVLNGLKAAAGQGYQPDFIGIDTWAVDYALLDADGEIMGDIYSYRDGRTQKAAEAVHRHISFEQLYKTTGIQYQPFNTIYQLFADKRGGKLERASYFLMLPDYLNYRLTGVKKQEYTNATSTGMVNALSHDWDGDIIDSLGYDRKLFGVLSQPGTVVGRLKKEVADYVGYNAAVVLPATHDTASAVLAAPIEFGQAYISSGTWSLLGAEQPFAHTDDESRNANYSNEGSVNFTFRYQKNIMGLWMLQSIKKELGGITFPELINLARGKEKNYIVDVNDKRFLSPQSMIAEINAAVGRELGTASLVRTVYDSLALSYKQAIEELEVNTGAVFDSINIIGGGSRDGLLNELTSKVTGKKVITGPVEATATGNIIAQMISAGEIKDISAAREIIKNSFEISEVQV